MRRFVIALSLAAIASSALPALAGPNGGSQSFFPLYKHRKHAAPKPVPRALLGDTSEETPPVRALRPGVTGKHPTRTFLRRPSEGK